MQIQIYESDRANTTRIFTCPRARSWSAPAFIHPLGCRPPSGVCPPSRVSHSARPPLVPGQVVRPHFPTAPPTSRHPNLSPPPNPNLSIPPPNSPPSLHPPTRPNMPSIICPTYPPLTSPALPPISFPPVRPTRTTPNMTYPLSLRIKTPLTSLTLQPPSPFTLCILFSCITSPALFLHTFPHLSYLHTNAPSPRPTFLTSLSSPCSHLYPCPFCLSHLSKCSILSATFSFHPLLSLVKRSTSVQSIPASLNTLLQYSKVFLFLPAIFPLPSKPSYHPSTTTFVNLSFSITCPILSSTLLSIFHSTDLIPSLRRTSVIFTCLSAICRKGSPFLSLHTYL